MQNLPYEQAVTILRHTPFDELRREYGSLNAAWETATALLREAERFEDERAIRLASEPQEPADEWLERLLWSQPLGQGEGNAQLRYLYKRACWGADQ